MSEEPQSQDAAAEPASGGSPLAVKMDDLTGNIAVLRRRLALLTGLVVADTAMLIVLLILAR